MESPSIHRHTNIAALRGCQPKGRGGFAGSKLARVLADIGAVAQGPWFLSAVSLVLLLTIPAAQATLLKGCVQTDMFAPAAGIPGQDESASEEPLQQSGLRPTEGRRPQTADSFPLSFAGTWRCVTVVVDSALPSVPVGETIESAVSFIKQPDGRVLALWEQPGWTEAKQHVQPFNENEATMERTNYFLEGGQGGQWAAHSQDHYLKVDPNRMTAESKVDQFVGGQFMGRYETRSMLYRLNIAMKRGGMENQLP